MDKNTKKYIKILLIILVPVLLVVSFFPERQYNDIKTPGDAKLATYKDCDNDYEIQKFDPPIPVVWTAKFTGCLSSCWGAAFTREPVDEKYPRFSGYVPDEGERIADKFMKKGQILKIHGMWTDVSDSYGSVFNNKCVPTVEIEKIEIVDQKIDTKEDIPYSSYTRNP